MKTKNQCYLPFQEAIILISIFLETDYKSETLSSGITNPAEHYKSRWAILLSEKKSLTETTSMRDFQFSQTGLNH